MATSQDSAKPKDDNSYSLLATNDLVYVLPPDLSVSVNQTHKNQFFQSSIYTDSQRAICIFNTGADYVDMRNSSLEFTVKMPAYAADGLAYLGRNGSALNLIKSITISSRSGDELARVNDFNLLAYHRNPLKYPKAFFETVGQGMLHGEYFTSSNHGQLDATYGGLTRVSIPAFMLSDLFGYGRLFPAQLASGLRVEIEWARPDEAFLACGGATRLIAIAGGTHTKIPSYEIVNPIFALRTVQLTDATQRALNELSATNGLELVYCDYERTDRVDASTSTLHMEVRKAVSRALHCQMITRVSTAVTSEKKDSFKSEPWDYTKHQWQLGSLYYPQQPVQTTGLPHEILPESYKHALISFDKYKSMVPGKCAALPLWLNSDRTKGTMSKITNPRLGNDALGLVTTARTFGVGREQESKTVYATFAAQASSIIEPLAVGGIDESAINPYQYGTYAEGNSSICTTLERSDLFNLSGVPINNARVLSIRADYKTPEKPRHFTAFLKYVRLARVFLNNVEVEQ